MIWDPGGTTDPSVARTALEEDDPHPDTSPGGASWVDFDDGMWVYEDGSRYDAEGWRNAGGEAINDAGVVITGECVEEPDCPEGFEWDLELGDCVEIPPGEECPEGFEWNEELSLCTAEPPVPPPNVPGPGPGRPPTEAGDPVDPATLFTVELLGWNDGGLGDDPVGEVVVAGITPGTDCLLVVLVNALPTITNTALLAPDRQRRRTQLVPSPRRRPGRRRRGQLHHDDPGRPGRSGHIRRQRQLGGLDDAVRTSPPCGRVNNAVNDYVEKFDDGFVLYAVVDSNPPEEAQPGDGPQTVTMVADNPPVGFPALSRAVDITIAQSLAEEGTEPFGAIVRRHRRAVELSAERARQPAPELLDTLWSDDFERADGPLGDDWMFGMPVWYHIGVNQLIIEDGAAIGTVPVEVSLEGPFLDSMRWADPQGPDQTVEVVVENVWPNGSVQLFAHGNDDDKSCHAALFYVSSPLGAPGVTSVNVWLYDERRRRGGRAGVRRHHP